MDDEISQLRSQMIQSRVTIAAAYVVLGSIYIWFSSGVLTERVAEQLALSAVQFEMIKGLIFVFVSGVLFLVASRLFDMRHLKSYRELIRSRRHLAELKHFERLGDIAGGLSHDLRNLLQVLQLHIQELRRSSGKDEPAGEDTGLAEKLQTQSQRLLEMSEALTEAFTSDREAKHREKIRLDEFVHRELELVRPLMSDGEIVFRNALDVAELEVDRLQLHRLLLNLLQNAARAAEHGDRIVLELREAEEGDAELIISNTGEAIPEEVVEKFNREIELSRMRTGHGWGLNIIRTAASEVGASIEAERRGEEGGARFRVSFERAAET